MKSNKLGVVISGVVMLMVIVVICIFSIGSVKKGGPLVETAAQGELRNTIEIPLAEAADISIAYTSDNFKIYPTDGDTIIIKEYLSSKREDALACVDISDGKAVVTGGKRDVFTFWLWISVNERIEIYLPKEGIEKLNLEAKSGNITAEDSFSCTVGSASITATSGNIKWKNTTGEQVAIEASSGNVKAENIHAQEVKIGTKSGNVSAEDVSGVAEISASSGNVKVTEFSGQGTVEAKSGNVKVEAEEITGDISLQASSGNVKLVMPKGLSFELETNTGSGNIHTDFDENLSYNTKKNQAVGTVGEAPVFKIFAKAGSGNVTIIEN